MSQLRRELGIPVGDALHWKDHVKTFSRRQHVTNVLTQVEPVVLNYVLVEKSAVPASAGMRSDQAIFYNFAAALVLERVLLAAKNWPGGTRDAVIRFSHVKGFNHTKTTDYFDLRRRTNNPHYIPWHLQRGRVHFDGQARWDGLQAADQYAGMLHAALRRDNFGNHEPQHFLAAMKQLRRGPDGKAWTYGFKFLGNLATLQALPWWHQAKT